MDGVEPDTLARIEQAAHTVSGVHGVRTVRARWSGHRLLADPTITLDGHCTLIEAHDISEQLLHDLPLLEDAWIHTDPATQDDDPHHSPPTTAPAPKGPFESHERAPVWPGVAAA